MLDRRTLTIVVIAAAVGLGAWVAARDGRTGAADVIDFLEPTDGRRLRRQRWPASRPYGQSGVYYIDVESRTVVVIADEEVAMSTRGGNVATVRFLGEDGDAAFLEFRVAPDRLYRVEGRRLTIGPFNDPSAEARD